MQKLLMKKKQEGKGLSDIQKEAKMNVVKDLRNYAADEMGKKLSGIKKVTVAAGSAEGLEEGLEKAKELAGLSEESEEDEEAPMGITEPQTEEEIEAKLMELQAKLAEIKASKGE